MRGRPRTADSVFTLSQSEREAALLPKLIELTEHHRGRCEGYARILTALGNHAGRRYDAVSDLPWLPVRLFKNHALRSIDDGAVFKVLTSSRTSGRVSRIYLDRDAAVAQQRALAATLRPVLGADRLPMLVVDTRALFDSRQVSARGAGVLGMMTFGRDHTFLLDDQDRIDVTALHGFLNRYGQQSFLIFGFTYLVWLYLYEIARADGLDLTNGILIHSGGWKHMSDRSVEPSEFRHRFTEATGLVKMHNFYGMVEQIGSIFLEGREGGSLYCHDGSDVIVRDPNTWAEVPVGTPGVIEVISTLPRSYPGHVLLTEDQGVVHGVDDGTWPGKRFSILGRLPRAEARGCSDTLPAVSV